jgi:uncharacterized protein (TIGR02145 family)
MYYRFFVLSLFLLAFLFGCVDDNSSNPAKTAQITSISPTSGFVGDEITITGINFGTTQGTSYVTFNITKATEIISWSDTQIKVNVPSGATTGKVSVTTNGTKSNEVDFEVKTIETVTIGTQVWMKKNLDVDHYRNGDPIPQVTDSTQWYNLTTGAWCYYENDNTTYGKLYNWYAVNDPRGLAPNGYHVPSDAEWTVLSTYLGGERVAGGKMKETGTTHWWSPNLGATNSSGFSGLPGGCRYYNGNPLSGGYHYIDSEGNWWSSTEGGEGAWSRYLHYKIASVNRYDRFKVQGFSVRCVRD